MFKGYIYRHWIIDDEGVEKSYIGQVYRSNKDVNPQERWGKDGKGYAPKEGDKPTKFYDAIQEYEWNNFQHNIILKIECEKLEELVFWLDEWEKYYIEKYDSYYNGYNSTTGGTNGIVSEETKEKMSKARKGKKHTDETKRKMSEAQIGHEVKDSTKQKISEALQGKLDGENNPFYGLHHTDESKQKIGDSVNEYYSTHEHPWTGKTHTEESKKKISDSKIGTQTLGDNPRARKCVCINTGQVFSCMEEAKQWCIGLTKSQPISWVCSGKRKSAGKHPVTGEKLHWMYYEDWLKLQDNN